MLASKIILARLKTKVDDLGVDKLKTVTSDLSKLSNVADNDLSKKTVHDKLVINANAVDTKILSTTRLVTKTQYHSEKHGIRKKIANVNKKIPNVVTSGLVKKTGYNTAIRD